MVRHSWLLAVLGLLCMLFHLVARLVGGGWGGWPAGVGGLGLLLWLAWLWLDQAPLRRAAASRAVRFHAVAGLLVLLSVALAVGLNVLAHRFDQRWDLTTGGRHTLAPQTVRLLEGLDRQVTAVAFFPLGSTDEASFLDLAEAYRQHTDALEIEIHDPMHDPVTARRYGVTSTYGTVILEAGDERQRLETSFDEQALSNALLRLVSGVEHSVCFLQDHGEADPDDDEPEGMSVAVMKLEGQGYRVERTSILQHGGVPAHCEVLVVANPQVDPLPEEREAVAAHLLAGRSALLLLEPLLCPTLAQDLARYGLSLAPDLVLQDSPELRRLGFDPSHITIAPEQLDHHPITNELDSMLYLQLARSMETLEDVPEGLLVQILARSTPGAWGETSLMDDAQLEPTPGEDRIGAIGLAVAVEIADPAAVPLAGHDLVGETEAAAADAEVPSGVAGGKLVVVGDATFATNEALLDGLNQDLFLNSVAWLAGEEDQLSIRPNEAAPSQLEPNLAQALIMWFLALFGLPGLAIAAALWTWFRRRRM